MPHRLAKAWNQAYEDHKIIGLTIVASIAVFFVFLGVLVATAIFSHNQRENCRGVLAVRDGMVFVLRDARAFIVHPPKGIKRQPKADRIVAIQFYDRNIRRLQSIHCTNR